MPVCILVHIFMYIRVCEYMFGWMRVCDNSQKFTCVVYGESCRCPNPAPPALSPPAYSGFGNPLSGGVTTQVSFPMGRPTFQVKYDGTSKTLSSSGDDISFKPQPEVPEFTFSCSRQEQTKVWEVFHLQCMGA